MRTQSITAKTTQSTTKSVTKSVTTTDETEQTTFKEDHKQGDLKIMIIALMIVITGILILMKFLIRKCE